LQTSSAFLKSGNCFFLQRSL